jgi:hypothetical protein
MIIAEFEAFGTPACICPKRFNDLSGDAFGGCDFFRAGASEDYTSHTINFWRREPHVPIVSIRAGTVEIKLPRCASDWHE